MSILEEAKQNHRLRMVNTYLKWLLKQPQFIPHVKSEIVKTRREIHDLVRS